MKKFNDVAFCIESIEDMQGTFFLDGTKVPMGEMVERYPQIKTILENGGDVVTELTHYLKNLREE